jgi:2-oxoglutarate dehydrogenase E1 component
MAASAVKEIIYGMAHRGRLNILANVMAKPYRVIFHEFSGGSANPEDVGGSGDVKYHLGTSTDREFDGTKVHMSLLPNPSHLETVDPIVLGKTLAQQQFRDDVGPGKHKQVLPVLIHGDAAFAGQGIVWECFGFSGVSTATTPAAASTSSSTTRSASPPARSSRAARRTLGRGQGRPGADHPRQRR